MTFLYQEAKCGHARDELAEFAVGKERNAPVCCCIMKDGTIVHVNHCKLNENGLQVCAGHSFCCHIPTPVLLRRMMCAESDTRRLFSLSLVKDFCFFVCFFVFDSKTWKSGLVKIQQTFKPPGSKHGKLIRSNTARFHCWFSSWTSFSTSFSSQPLWYFSLETLSTLFIRV